ncbi:MAG: universal stress protein [Nitrospirae bacterium]|nr:universal stress protein [Nitrospirota bacterium]
MKTFTNNIGDMISYPDPVEEPLYGKTKAGLKEHKTVLLAISDRMFDRHAFSYALNVSQRIGASMEILYITESGRERSGLKDFMSVVEQEGFRFSLVMKTGCVKKAILDYTNERSEIQFVIVGAELELNIGCEFTERAISKAWKKLKCPLVVVSKNMSAPN